MERNYKLYVHISPSNKRYYGITSQKVEIRWQGGNGYTRNQHFKNAIKKYGWNNFEHIVLFDNLTEEEAKLMEQMYIALYDTTNRDKGYNITLGGESASGYHHTEKTKERLRKSSTGRKGVSRYGKDNPNYGNGDKIKGEKNPFYGKHHTEETRKKISEARKKLKGTKGVSRYGKDNPMAKAVICLTTGKSFYTQKEAGEYYNIKSCWDIGKCCKGKVRHCGRLENGTQLRWKELKGDYLLNMYHNKTYRIKNIENNQEAS